MNLMKINAKIGAQVLLLGSSVHADIQLPSSVEILPSSIFSTISSMRTFFTLIDSQHIVSVL